MKTKQDVGTQEALNILQPLSPLFLVSVFGQVLCVGNGTENQLLGN